MIKLHLNVLVDAVFRLLLAAMFVAIFVLTGRDAQAQATTAASNVELTNWIIGAGLALLSILVSLVGFFLTRTLKAIEAGQDKIVEKFDKMDERVKNVEISHGEVKRDVGHFTGRLERLEGRS